MDGVPCSFPGFSQFSPVFPSFSPVFPVFPGFSPVFPRFFPGFSQPRHLRGPASFHGASVGSHQELGATDRHPKVAARFLGEGAALKVV